jgi:hypothetical protein
MVKGKGKGAGWLSVCEQRTVEERVEVMEVLLR